MHADGLSLACRHATRAAIPDATHDFRRRTHDTRSSSRRARCR